MDAKERIRAAREGAVPITARKSRATSPAAEVTALSRAEVAEPYPVPSPPVTAAAKEPGPETANWAELQQRLAVLQVAMERNQREANQNLWTVGITCTLLALAVTVIGQRMTPRPSLEDQRLQQLGADVEERWQTLSEKERRQVEKIMGWTRPTEPRAQ